MHVGKPKLRVFKGQWDWILLSPSGGELCRANRTFRCWEDAYADFVKQANDHAAVMQCRNSIVR